jgi:hypothetical protein
VTLPPVEQIPGPPPGPGVRAPFAAPPTERDRKRMWIGLGVGAALLVVCCGGGLVAFIGLVVAQNRAIPAEATAVVNRYLDDVTHEDFRDAYDQLCGADQDKESLQEFTTRKRTEATIEQYQVGQPRVEQSQVEVPVHLYTSSGFLDWIFTLVEDQQAGGLRICGGE